MLTIAVTLFFAAAGAFAIVQAWIATRDGVRRGKAIMAELGAPMPVRVTAPAAVRARPVRRQRPAMPLALRAAA